MTIKITIFFVAICAFTSNAQNLNQKLISNGGNYFLSGNYNLSWSIGEPVTATHSTGTNKISQGFHQPPLKVTSINENHSDISIVIYPNPTQSTIQIYFPTADESYNLCLYDLAGKLIRLEEVKSVKNFSLDLNELSSGQYQLSITNATNSKKLNYKILKSE